MAVTPADQSQPETQPETQPHPTLCVLSRHFLLSLDHIKPHLLSPHLDEELREAKKLSRLEEMTFDPESYLPKYPEQLVHEDLSSYGLIWHKGYSKEVIVPAPPQKADILTAAKMIKWQKRNPRFYGMEGQAEEISWDQAMEEATQETVHNIVVRVGTVRLSIAFPVSPSTPICFDCGRPLELYLVTERSEELPRGWCPEHLLLKEWRQEARSAELLAKKENRRFDKEKYVEDLKSRFLSQWRLSDYSWWEEQKANNSPIYSNWKEKMLSRLLNGVDQTANLPR